MLLASATVAIRINAAGKFAPSVDVDIENGVPTKLARTALVKVFRTAADQLEAEKETVVERD